MVASPSAVALAALLDRGGVVADAVRARIHRTQLWAYVTGRATPSAKNAAMMHKVTRGRVAAHGWVKEAA